MSVLYLPTECIHHYYHGVRVFEFLKTKYVMHKTESLEKRTIVYLRHIKYIMLYGKQMFQTAYEIAMSKILAYSSSKYALPHWKCVLRCCMQFSWMDFTSAESYHNSSNVSPTI